MDTGNLKKQWLGAKGQELGARGWRLGEAFTQPLAPSPQPLPQSGFTLLEVMIALVIVAIALVTLLGLGNRSIDVNGRLQRITQATLLAQQRMSEIEVKAAQQQGVTLQNEDGIFEEPFSEYRWRVAYQDTPLQFLQQVTVTVAWGDEGKNEMVDLDSFVVKQ